MAKLNDDGEETTDCKAVFVDTNLDTSIAIPVFTADTVFDLKRKILTEHSKCFQNFGEIYIHALKVKRRGKLYALADSMPLRSVFPGTANGRFLFADITSQSGHHEAINHSTDFLPNPLIRMLSGPSFASPLHRGYRKDERNLQTDNLFGEARSENLQLVTGLTNDENLKTSSSDTDKRLHAIVKDIYDAYSKEENVIYNPLSKPSDIRYLEKKNSKKRRMIAQHVPLNGNDAVEFGSADKDSASLKLEITKNLDQTVRHSDHVDNSVGDAAQKEREDESSQIIHCRSSYFDHKNTSVADIEQTVGPHNEENTMLESLDRELKYDTMGSDKTKGTPKKKNNRMGKVEVMNDETYTDIDASASVSAKFRAVQLDAVEERSLRNVGRDIVNFQFKENDISGADQRAYPDKAIVTDSGTTEKHDLLQLVKDKNTSIHVQCNKSNVGIPMSMDEDGTEEIRKIECAPEIRDHDKEATTFGIALESGMKRSKKRKNSGDDVSLQMDIQRNDELGVSDIGEMEKGTVVSESGMSRPLKRKKTGADVPDVIKMDRVGDEKSGTPNITEKTPTKKSKRKNKKEQAPAVKNTSEFATRDQIDTLEPEKKKFASSDSAAAEKDDDVGSLSSPHKLMGKAAPVIASEADIEISTEVGVSNESDVRTQGGDDETLHNDAEAIVLTQTQKNVEGADVKIKRSSKKTKQKQNLVANDISEFYVKGQNSIRKCDMSKSACSKLNEKNDELDVLSSCQEQIDKVASVTDANAVIEIWNAEGGVDDKVATNHGTDVISHKKVHVIMQYDKEPKKLSQILKSETGNESKRKKLKKNNKQKQSHPLTSISELSKSTWSRSEAEKDVESLSSPIEQVDNISQISVSQADVEISAKSKINEVIITNHGNNVDLQQEADDACQDDVEPTQPNQVRSVTLDTDNKKVPAKKRSKQQQTQTGNGIPNVVDGGEGDTRIDIASTRLGNRNDSRTSSSRSDKLNKRSRQGKAMAELPKMKQNQSILGKSSCKRTEKAVQNQSRKKGSILDCISIFEDESNSSSEDKGGSDASDSSTETPQGDHHVASSDSEDESRGSWVSPKHGNSKTGQSTLDSKSMQKNLTLESILRSSHRYKKAKLIASQLQLEDDESQPIDVAPVSQVKK